MESMNKVQERVVWLLDHAEPKENLEKWVIGYIPKNYKRLNISMRKAKKYAMIGLEECLTLFNTTPFFTQALIFGAVKSGEIKTLTIVTPSQYGKSFISSRIAISMAHSGLKVRVAGGDQGTTEIIMQNIIEALQDAHEEIQANLLDYSNKIEKLQSSVTKQRLTFQNGGLIESISIGASTTDAKKHNKAIGRGGNFIIDEASLIPDDASAEMGRREFSSVDGKKEIMLQISNPHQQGGFYDDLTKEDPDKDELIVWMDIRTSFEEGRVKSKEQVVKSKFFKNKSTCQRYFLCELENYAEESMFSAVDLNDSPYEGDIEQFFLGIDSAYKGKDRLKVALSGLTKYGKIRVLDIWDIDKANWEDGKTSIRIKNQIMAVIRQFHVHYICLDIGQGIYLNEMLTRESGDFICKGINFGSGPTKFRVDNGQFSAKYATNVRTEMHIDLQQLIDSHKISFTTGVAKMIAPEMSVCRTYTRPNGKMNVISKPEIKQKLGHSPDALDATLLTVHACLLYAMSGGVYVYTDND